MSHRDDLDALRARLREAGLRVTASRVAVLRLLRQASTALSHAEVADQLQDGVADRATIYRNLLDLVAGRLARRTDLGDHVWRFEAVDAGHGAASHPHFVCSGCGVVECMPDVTLARRRGQALRAVRRQPVEVQVHGRCDACAKVA